MGTAGYRTPGTDQFLTTVEGTFDTLSRRLTAVNTPVISHQHARLQHFLFNPKGDQAGSPGKYVAFFDTEGNRVAVDVGTERVEHSSDVLPATNEGLSDWGSWLVQ